MAQQSDNSAAAAGNAPLGTAAGLGMGAAAGASLGGGFQGTCTATLPGCDHRHELQRLRSRNYELERRVEDLTQLSPWHNAHCDGCGRGSCNLKNVRLRCTTCADADYCLDCAAQGKTCKHAYTLIYSVPARAVRSAGIGIPRSAGFGVGYAQDAMGGPVPT